MVCCVSRAAVRVCATPPLLLIITIYYNMLFCIILHISFVFNSSVTDGSSLRPLYLFLFGTSPMYVFVFKKNLNASKPSEYLHLQEKNV